MPNESSLYTILETLRRGRDATVLRAVRKADGRPVLLEVLDPRHARPRDVERLRHEREIGALLDPETAAAVLGLGTYRGLPALVLADFGGEPLARLLGAPMPVERFLDLAIPVAEAVAAVHERGVVHRALEPANVLVHPVTGRVKLTGFGIASRLTRERAAPARAGLVEGSLPYLAPEQTGRTNRPVDGRADLYALGVTFYEMLTGRRPFEATDPLEWIHCHVARPPPPPTDIVPALPGVLCAIVLKLLAKMVEDRYQTARGLRHDLERCRAALRATGRIDPFPPGERDLSDRLEVPRRLRGREAEIAALRAALDRVIASAAPEMVLVSGPPGTGKSSLVGELRGPVARAGGFFAAGKFDQAKQNIPYSTVVQAGRELVLEILAQSEERVAAWRQRLLAALGGNAGLVVEVIPQVELVVGPQPPVPDLPPAEAQGRFRAVLRAFIGGFARTEHPLVLFLDDLQWADAASLALMRDLVTDPEPRCLLVAGAYRDGEVDLAHPLVRAVAGARAAGARVASVALGPLAREHVAALVGEALRCGPAEAAPLADLIHDKTAGNPFFALQFLATLHEERLVALDARAGAFRWDVAKIRAKGFTDNVIDLMVHKLARLPRPALEVLERLACLGTRVDVSLLATACGRSEEALHADLLEAVIAGLVLRVGGAYRLLHDRVREAIYACIPEGERAVMHLAIGRLLAARAGPRPAPCVRVRPPRRSPPRPRRIRAAPGGTAEDVFEIVNQLDRGAALITSPEEREQVAGWNLLAARRARRATAYAAALRYLAAGSALLPEDRWARCHELAFALELHRAECEHLTGELERAEERLAALQGRASGLSELASVACARVALYTALDRSDRAVEACLDYLRRVGVDWSPHPGPEEVQREYEQIWQRLGSRAIEDLADLPPMRDPVCRATMEVLTSVNSPALFTDEDLHGLVACRMVNLTCEHGVSDGSCLAFVRFGMLLGPRFGDYGAGFRFGEVGLELLERHGLLRFRARVYLDFGALVSPWSRPVRAGLDLLRRALAVAHEAGDPLYGSYTRNCLITLLLAAGEPLGEVQREIEGAAEYVKKVRFGLVSDILATQLGLVRALRGLTPGVACFGGPGLDEARFEAHLGGDPRLSIAACWYWIRKLQARVLGGDPAGAIEAAERAEGLLWTSGCFFEVAEYHFHGALARAARASEAPEGERARHVAALSAHGAQLAVWAASCPESFGCRSALVAAEIGRVEGRLLDAERLYEQAIRSAREEGLVQVEGLACEAASRFYRARGLDVSADAYLREARACHARWGADGKVAQMDREHPGLFGPSPAAPAAPFAARSEELDLLSVAKASQTISGEIVLEKLVPTLLQVVLEQGGAQRACLRLWREGGPPVDAEAAFDRGETVTTVLESAPAGVSGCVPASVIHYVRRTREPVILSDAAAGAGRFAEDEYLVRRRPRSVLCMPVLRRGEVAAVLYLENDLVADAFTPERLAALELLAAQTAISLENADLYRRTREAIRARDEFLSMASHELNTPVTALLLTLQSMDRAVRSGRGIEPALLGKQVARGAAQAARLKRLNEALLSVSRFDTGRLELVIEPVQLGPLVREVVERAGPEIERSGCVVTVVERAPVAGRWDRARVAEILSNLLSNALKFGAGAPVEIACGEESGAGWITVTDHGIGIPAALQGQIFDRFRRAASRNYGGLGLGLYISRRIAEAHGGSIRVRSELGAGATFTVALPCAGPPSTGAPPDAAAPPP